MEPKKKYRLLRGLFKTVFFTLAMGAVLVGAILLRLYHEPLDLAFLQKEMENALKPSLGEVSLSFREPRLIWKGIGFPLEVQTQDLKVMDKKTAQPLLQAPLLRVSFRFRSLLLGQLIPATATLEKPQGTLTLEDETQSQDPDRLLPFLQETFLTPSSSKALKRLKIIDANITLNKGGTAWHLPRMSFTFERKHNHLEGMFDAHISDTQHLSTTLIFDPKENLWRGSGVLEQIELMPLLSHFESWAGPWQELTSTLAGSTLTLSGKGDFAWSPLKGFQEGHIALKVPEGVLALPKPLLPQPLAYQKGEFSLSLNKGLLILDTLSLTFQGARLHGKGTAQMTQNGPVELLLNLEHFAFPKLQQIWPQGLAEPARAWLVQHITQGHVPLATAQLKGTLTFQKESALPSFGFGGISGKIVLEKALLTYLPTMPAVQDIDAQALYTQDHFDINVTKGTSHGLTLSQGRVVITGLTQDQQTLALKVTAQGDLPKTLDLINKPPLEALKDLPFSLKEGSGQVKGTFELSFPLKDTLSGPDFTFAVDAQTQNAAFQNIFTKLPVTLTQGDVSLKIKEDLLTCEGKTHLNGDGAQMTVQKDLAPNGRRPFFLRLKGRTSLPGLMQLGVDASPYASGTASYTLSVEEKSGNVIQIQLGMDLKDAALTYGTWQKPTTLPGKIEATMALKGGALREISRLHARAKDLELDAAVQFTSQGDVASGTLANLHLGKTHISGTLTPGRHKDYALKIQGKSLDLGPYIATFKEAKTADAALGKSFDLRLSLPEIYLSDAQTLYDNTLSLGYTKERVQTLTYKGHFDPEAKKFFFADMIPRAQDGRKFRLKCENGGALLKSFDLSRNISKGTLKLVAEQGSRDSDLWEGKLELDEFWVKDAPLLGRLLALAFPTGLVGAFSGKGLKFDRLKASFKFNAHRLLVPQGRAFGPSFGFSLKGSLDKNFEEMNFNGTIYPAYFINMAISRIPLLGQLLTGGKNEGLWGVSYTITGPRGNPSIQVNPLTALTPGILRKLFMPTTNEDMDFDEADLAKEKLVD